mmetsp:Transcript_34011/g.95643  ORF Transcript_34011/g.95643 Transcript_34011/m.95643 type:complete len:221 (-) Transcript_34011:333-995(-)
MSRHDSLVALNWGQTEIPRPRTCRPTIAKSPSSGGLVNMPERKTVEPAPQPMPTASPLAILDLTAAPHSSQRTFRANTCSSGGPPSKPRTAAWFMSAMSASSADSAPGPRLRSDPVALRSSNLICIMFISVWFRCLLLASANSFRMSPFAWLVANLSSMLTCMKLKARLWTVAFSSTPRSSHARSSSPASWALLTPASSRKSVRAPRSFAERSTLAKSAW